ncbi:MAG: rifampicin phosphotransferase, partial [Solirubrobacteraceae bacterium]|nr:rifampicin phosphotransferase [Solirubrobacteraceae bacterium]
MVARLVFDADWDPDAYWSTTNLGEAIPGVLTPVTWALWGGVGERAARQSFVHVGALSAEEGETPEDPRKRLFGIFLGRFACKVDGLAEIGDRLPGTSGAEMAEQILGTLPPGFESHPTKRRWPVIAVRMPRNFARAPKRIRPLRDDVQAWWLAATTRAPTLDLPAAQALWRDGERRFEETLIAHGDCLFGVVQVMHQAVEQLVASSGAEAALVGRLLAGQGSHAELEVVDDLWALSREQITLETFLSRHGYHGPMEGEASARVWRDDPAPVLGLAKQYARKPDAESPAAVAALRAGEREEAQRTLLALLPAWRRPLAAALLRQADKAIPLRGVGKRMFLQAMDVTRAATRRIGTLLHEQGALADPEDAFYLEKDELTGGALPSLQTVAARKAERERLQGLTLPGSWRGRPVPMELEAIDEDAARDGLSLDG